MIVIWHSNNTVKVWTGGHSICVRLEEYFLGKLEHWEGQDGYREIYALSSVSKCLDIRHIGLW